MMQTCQGFPCWRVYRQKQEFEKDIRGITNNRNELVTILLQ